MFWCLFKNMEDMSGMKDRNCGLFLLPFIDLIGVQLNKNKQQNGKAP